MFEAVDIDGGGCRARGGCPHCAQTLNMRGVCCERCVVRGEAGFRFGIWGSQKGRYVKLNNGCCQELCSVQCDWFPSRKGGNHGGIIDLGLVQNSIKGN